MWSCWLVSQTSPCVSGCRWRCSSKRLTPSPVQAASFRRAGGQGTPGCSQVPGDVSLERRQVSSPCAGTCSWVSDMPFIVGPQDSAYGFLQATSARFDIRNGVIVVAWARPSGVGLLHSALGEHLQNVDVVVGMAHRGTSAEALALLRRLSRRIFVYHKHHLQTFHPKVYLFYDGQDPVQDAALLVGSSNLTGGGLYQNIEGNLALDLRPSDSERDWVTYDSVVQEVMRLQDSPYCEEITGDERIRHLLTDRYISTEAVLRRKRRRDNGEVTRRGELGRLPEAPPPPLPPQAFRVPQLEVNFVDAGQEDEVDGPPVVLEPDDVVYDPTEQFYVRTLTENDVNKLRGITSGTAEWNIGEVARNERPAFWGWPGQYANVVRRLPRLEWQVAGSLRSSSTGTAGEDVDVVLWFREGREGHAAEHRLRIGPRTTLVDAVPDGFDTTSLVVLERLPAGRAHTFLVHLLTNVDQGYNEYLGYLNRNRQQHRYGYGP